MPSVDQLLLAENGVGQGYGVGTPTLHHGRRDHMLEPVVFVRFLHGADIMRVLWDLYGVGGENVGADSIEAEQLPQRSAAGPQVEIEIDQPHSGPNRIGQYLPVLLG